VISNYLQTSYKKQAAQFLETIPEGCVIEITVHSEQKKLKAPRASVALAGKPAYDLDFVNKKYLNVARGIEFYMTDAEAFALNMYLCSGILEPISPHWWPYAERNIARHGDPLKELREAKEYGLDIDLSFY